MKICYLIGRLNTIVSERGNIYICIEDNNGFYEISEIHCEEHLDKENKEYNSFAWVCKLKRKHYRWEQK